MKSRSSDTDLQGRRVLLLGGLGFIGINLVPELLRAGASVRIVNRSENAVALAWLARMTGGGEVPVVRCEIADLARLRPEVRAADLIVDLAAESSATTSGLKPTIEAADEVFPRAAMLDDLCSAGRAPRLLFLSSRLVYGRTGTGAATETDLPRPTSFYGLQKIAVENCYRSYADRCGIPVVIVRLTNPYGPFRPLGGREHGVVNRFIISALRNETIRLFGGGGQLRDYVHVADVAQALIRCLVDPNAIGETLNVGSGVSIPMREMATRIVREVGTGRVESAPWPERYREVETGDFRCSIDRIRAVVGWAPRLGLEEGLRAAVAACRELEIVTAEERCR